MKALLMKMIRIFILSSVILLFNCANEVESTNNNDTTSFATVDQLGKVEESLTTIIKNNKVEIENLLDKKIQESKDPNIIIIIVGIINFFVLAILIIGIILWFLRSEKLEKYIVNKILNNYELEKMISAEFKKSIEHKLPSSTLSPNAIKELVRKEIEIFNSTVKDRRISENQKDQVLENKIQKDQKSMPLECVRTSSPKYLKGKSGNKFNIVDSSPDGSFFKIINENNNFAEFEFSGIQEEAIAKRIFSEDISRIISGSYENWIFVKTEKPGEIKCVGDHWEVTKPIEVKLI